MTEQIHTFEPEKYNGKIYHSLAEAYQGNRDAQNRYNIINRDYVKIREHTYYIEILKPRRLAQTLARKEQATKDAEKHTLIKSN
jgi:hypothetical protein